MFPFYAALTIAPGYLLVQVLGTSLGMWLTSIGSWVLTDVLRDGAAPRGPARFATLVPHLSWALAAIMDGAFGTVPLGLGPHTLVVAPVILTTTFFYRWALLRRDHRTPLDLASGTRVVMSCATPPLQEPMPVTM